MSNWVVEVSDNGTARHAVTVVVSSVDRQLHTDNSTREIREDNNNELFCVTEKGTGKNRIEAF
jgi:hypothetical protein